MTPCRRFRRRPAGLVAQPFRALGAVLLLVATSLAPSPAAAAPLDEIELTLVPVAAGFARPLGLTHAGDGSGRIFVIEQEGTIRVVRDGAVLPTPFLDLRGQVSCCGERGLLGLAFHPEFATNRRFYVSFTDPAGDSRVVEYLVGAGDPDRALPGSARLILAVPQVTSNHNGGHLAFGLDGFLYFGLGDGGAGGDPFRHGQNLTTLLGSILRLDVDATDPGLAYAIPPGNPTYPGVAGARREIWAYGVRNPWRFSIDRLTGDLLIGDVGQSAWEEINVVAAGVGGANLGWNRTEGRHCFSPPSGCDMTGLTEPVVEYSHSVGCSVTGGFRYRGRASPALAGVYVYGDFCEGTIWGAVPGTSTAWSSETLLATNLALSSFGEDEAGEIYAVDLVGGGIHRLAATGPSPDPDGWLTSPEIPGFRVRVKITADGAEPPVRQELPCLPETMCISGAIPGRSEVFVRMVGPKQNGRLWPTLVRFSTSTIEITIEQLATGITKQYVLEGVIPGSDELDGLVDRDGFEP